MRSMQIISELSTEMGLMTDYRRVFDDSSATLLCNVGQWLDPTGESAA